MLPLWGAMAQRPWEEGCWFNSSSVWVFHRCSSFLPQLKHTHWVESVNFPWQHQLGYSPPILPMIPIGQGCR